MIPVQTVIPDALASVLRQSPLTAEKVTFAWRTAVGASVHNATTVALKGRVLHVRAKDPAWQREIRRSLGVIRPRLDALLGSDVIDSIDIASE